MKWTIVFGVLLMVYLNNASWLRDVPDGAVRLLAHRGVHQTYSKENLDRHEGCTADRIDPPQHAFLENTIASIHEAFAYGADIVEIDIHPTIDEKFAVFHDWKIDCRTNGTGKTRDHSLTYLQSLDIGFGYTSDGGKTYPFRGKGVGKLPSLTEILERFPKQKFLVNIKSNSISEAKLINQFLDDRPNEDLRRLWFYGGQKPTSRLLQLKFELRGFTRSSVKKCAIHYELIGWTGYVPKACHNTIVVIPEGYAPYFWGWPRLFTRRMQDVGTEIILVGQTEDHLDGIDSPKRVAELGKDYRGILWTDNIEQVGTKAKVN